MNAELLYAAGETDIVAFRNSAKVPKYGLNLTAT